MLKEVNPLIFSKKTIIFTPEKNNSLLAAPLPSSRLPLPLCSDGDMGKKIYNKNLSRSSPITGEISVKELF